MMTVQLPWPLPWVGVSLIINLVRFVILKCVFYSRIGSEMQFIIIIIFLIMQLEGGTNQNSVRTRTESYSVQHFVLAGMSTTSSVTRDQVLRYFLYVLYMRYLLHLRPPYTQSADPPYGRNNNETRFIVHLKYAGEFCSCIFSLRLQR